MIFAMSKNKAAGKGLLLLTSILIFFLSYTALAAHDEAYGIVTNVVDGDTFDVAIEKASPKVSYSVERIRLADVDSPEMATVEGPAAKDFTYSILLNKRVYLDIDDLSATGRDRYDRLVCVARLSGVRGQIIPAPSFNRMLIDGGHAWQKDFKDNEFDPQDWWNEDYASSSENGAEDAQQELKDELLAEVEESAEKLLDRAARELWDWIKRQIGL
ncbi:MAG: thermonuclease family protein [Methanothrix sp.]